MTYPTWLANVVLIKKGHGKWRLCIDFTELNRAFSKDCFPLPLIDKLVEATYEFEFLTLVYALSGFHQIPMSLNDEEKTTFIIEKRTYCYKAMPFILKNIGATYQRLVNKIFKDQLGWNLEAYVNDMIIKSRSFEEHLKDLKEIFGVLDHYGMKLNPEKCSFFIKGGKFLGYIYG